MKYTKLQLQSWASEQRRTYRDGTLSAHRIKKLESLSGWAWKRPDSLPFEEARKFVRTLGLKSKVAWHAWSKSGKRPSNIPSSPNKTYAKTGWVSWGDWLGTGAISSRDQVFLPFTKARKFVRRLGLKSKADWKAWSASGKRPDNIIPSAPWRTYPREFKGLRDWLGV